MEKLMWRTAKGEYIPFYKMETNHLYNTVKMIYNNVINPSKFFIDESQSPIDFYSDSKYDVYFPYIEYDLENDPYRPREYLIDIFKNGFKELINRKDNQCAVKFIDFVNINIYQTCSECQGNGYFIRPVCCKKYDSCNGECAVPYQEQCAVCGGMGQICLC